MIRIMTCLDSTSDVFLPLYSLPSPPLSATRDHEDLWMNKGGEMQGFGYRVGTGIKGVWNWRLDFMALL